METLLLEQLKADYRLIYRVLDAEGKMRAVVFSPGHAKRKEKLEEIAQALAALGRIKEMLKAHFLINMVSADQLPLLEIPVERKEYQ